MTTRYEVWYEDNDEDDRAYLKETFDNYDDAAFLMQILVKQGFISWVETIYDKIEY